MTTDTSSAMSLVSRIHTDAAEFLTHKLSEKGLPDLASSHGFILFQLSKKDSMTMGELSEKVNRNKSTTTVLVRKLELAGLVTSKACSSDKRSRIISLTKKGRRYNELTADISAELSSVFYKNFSEQDKKQLSVFLSRIAENFEMNAENS